MGGVAGHLAHLYDNRDLTYNKMAEILMKAAQGELIGTENTDGYNIYLGFVDGKARAARNKGDMSRGGMTMQDLANRTFQGGESAKKAYVTAFKAYEKAIDSLSPEEKEKIFGVAGEIFYNTEIQGPVAPNVVNYDENVLNIHRMGHKRYNKDTNQLEVVDATEESAFLDNVIDRFEQATSGESFNVRRTAFLDLNRITDEVTLNTVLNKISATGYEGDMTLNQYLEEKIRPMIDEKFDTLDALRRERLLDRILLKEGAVSLTQIAKGLPREEKAKISQYVKNSKFIIKKLIEPIESAIHDFAVELLRGLKSAYVLDNHKEVTRLKKEVEEAIKAIKTYEGPEKETARDILVQQLKKLKHHDNIDTVVEGFAFQYDGQMYKFTGNFAPMNQLLGLFRYGRGSIPKMVKESILGEKQPNNQQRIIAIYPGRFQPMGRHHAAVFKEIQNTYGVENSFIATSNKVQAPKSPFDFSEKQQIAAGHGIDPSKIVMTKNPYKAVEVLDNFDPETTAVVYLVGAKDMQTDPRFASLGGLTKKGMPRYFRSANEPADEEFKNYMEHGYIDVAPHVEIDIPGYGEMSGTTLRSALKDATEEEFEAIMGIDDPEVYNLIKDKLNNTIQEGTQHFMGIFRGLVEEALEEMSVGASMGGGSVEIGAAAVVKKKKKKKKENLEEEDLIASASEYIDDSVDYLNKELEKAKAQRKDENMINRDELLTEIKNEQRLRKNIRGLLRTYLSEKKSASLNEEKRLRAIIRSLINEGLSADVAADQPQRSTGINVLENLLKNVIATIEDDYKSLTTAAEQRESFRAHILNAVQNSLRPAEVSIAAPGESELEEDVDLDIDVDADKFIPVRDQDQEPDPEDQEPETFQPIGGMNVTGRNFAALTFNKIENQILDAYESLADKDDRDVFEDYLLTNLKLYFDRFEEELQPTLPEPESPDYQKV